MSSFQISTYSHKSSLLYYLLLGSIFVVNKMTDKLNLCDIFRKATNYLFTLLCDIFTLIHVLIINLNE